MQGDYQKPLKKYFFFGTQSLLMDKVTKNKSGLELVTSCSSGYQTSSQKFLYQLYIIWPSLIVHYKVVFELFQNYTCKTIHNIINYFNYSIIPLINYSNLSFRIWKVWKGRGKITKNLNISRTKRAFWMK